MPKPPSSDELSDVLDILRNMEPRLADGDRGTRSWTIRRAVEHAILDLQVASEETKDAENDY